MSELKTYTISLWLVTFYMFIQLINSSQASILYYSKTNCSRFEPVQPYDVSDFLGTWNYVRLFTADPIRGGPNCLKMHSTINKSTISMNVSLPHPVRNGEILSTLVFGALDSRIEDKAQWIFVSDSPLAPSKWIILAQEELHALYLICGDFPDGSSAVGEIAILSRETQITDEVAAGFQDILFKYDLNVTFSIVQHNQCPLLLLN